MRNDGNEDEHKQHKFFSIQMQSKGAIKLLAVLLALACIYQLSFTFKTRGVEKAAAG